MKKPTRLNGEPSQRPVALHSHTSELVRMIRAAHRLHAEAREQSRLYARMLWAYRAAGMKPPPNSELPRNYAAARSRMANAAHLLERMQVRYKRRFGRRWILRRRDLRTGAYVGRRRNEGL